MAVDCLGRPADPHPLRAAHAEQLAKATHVLAAYTGEIERNDYREMLAGRATLSTGLGSEKVFGFGAPRASDAPYIKVLLEEQLSSRGWASGPPRVLDLDRPIPSEPAAAPSLDHWLRPQPAHPSRCASSRPKPQPVPEQKLSQATRPTGRRRV